VQVYRNKFVESKPNISVLKSGLVGKVDNQEIVNYGC